MQRNNAENCKEWKMQRTENAKLGKMQGIKNAIG